MFYKDKIKACLLFILVYASSYTVIGAPYPDQIVIESQPGAVLFSHGGHQKIPCKTCHHNVTTGKAVFTCRRCHFLNDDSEINSKKSFHGLCITCHLTDKKNNQKSGPAKLCSRCHIKQ